ncbi:MAG TPA: Coenzyme F420 hydrogenase/dehydrogenase, beta subunit C-terminal domain [Thermoanaerobaculia bacterium]|nr:Coenzyme F420 hydrogenase/dehydrogenase, beta subunit C-terminal domain [Thermoanaerobaculia bacterium]
MSEPALVTLGADPRSEYMVGPICSAVTGYASDADTRTGAASGGVVAALLLHLLESGEVTGCVTSRVVVRDGELDTETFIATTREEILDTRTSIYFEFDPFNLEVLERMRAHDGRLAVVGLPCDLSKLRRRCAKDPELAQRCHLLIGLYCAHTSRKELIVRVLAKEGVEIADLERFRFRTGRWRGQMQLDFRDGSHREIPFPHYSLYQNLFVLSAAKCMACADHYAEDADLATGDVWTKEAKRHEIKHSIFVSRNARGKAALDAALEAGVLVGRPSTPHEVFRANRRAVIYHKAIDARARVWRLWGRTLKTPPGAWPARWNERLGALIVIGIEELSKRKWGLRLIFALPRRLVWCVLAFFKLLSHY